MDTNTKCASCKMIYTETIQGSKILNKISSVKLCDKHKDSKNEL